MDGGDESSETMTIAPSTEGKVIVDAHAHLYDRTMAPQPPRSSA
jgi:hypothetical protein